MSPSITALALHTAWIPSCLLAHSAPLCMLTIATGYLKHTQSHRIAVRSRRRHAWLGVISRLHLLPCRHATGLDTALRAQNGWKARRILLQTSKRHVVGRRVWGAERFRAYLDVVLRAGAGMNMDMGERNRDNPTGKNGRGGNGQFERKNTSWPLVVGQKRVG
jgi:hypothetical protein